MQVEALRISKVKITTDKQTWVGKVNIEAIGPGGKVPEGVEIGLYFDSDRVGSGTTDDWGEVCITTNPLPFPDSRDTAIVFEARVKNADIRAKSESQPISGLQAELRNGKRIDLERIEPGRGPLQKEKECSDAGSESVQDTNTDMDFLANSIYLEIKKQSEAGADGGELATGVRNAIKRIVDELREMAASPESREDWRKVATIYTNGETQIGDYIAAGMEFAGKDGVVCVREAEGADTTLEFLEGIHFNSGFLSEIFVTDNERMEVVLRGPRILLHEKEIGNAKDLIPLLEKLKSKAQSLLIITEAIDCEALALILDNDLLGMESVAAVKAPGIKEHPKTMMEDIAIFTGGKMIGDQSDVNLQCITENDLGMAAFIVADDKHTSIIGGEGEAAEIEIQAEKIRSEIRKATNENEREILRERLARLVAGVAIIWVGGDTDRERKDAKIHFEAALHNTRAAAEEGIVPRNEVALSFIVSELRKHNIDELPHMVANVLAQALQSYVDHLMDRCNKNEIKLIESVMSQSKSWVKDNFLSMGIITPLKTTRNVLFYSASMALSMIEK